MSITSWPELSRPREKLFQHGVSSLQDGELLALFLGTGIKGKSAVSMSNDMLSRFGGLNGLLLASDEALRQLPGIGPAKLSRIRAVLELVKRYLSEQARQLPNLVGAQHTRDFLALQLQHHRREVFACLYLDAGKRVIEYEELFVGTVNQVAVYPREVAKQALALNSSYVILAHNHPSGRVQPSQSDVKLTQSLRSALILFDIELLDHVIIARGVSYSLKQHGDF